MITNAFETSLKLFQEQEGILKDCFCSNYSEMDFVIHGMEGINRNIETWNFEITFDNIFQLLGIKYFCNPNYI